LGRSQDFVLLSRRWGLQCKLGRKVWVWVWRGEFVYESFAPESII
jgi:hypothetical protein